MCLRSFTVLALIVAATPSFAADGGDRVAERILQERQKAKSEVVTIDGIDFDEKSLFFMKLNMKISDFEKFVSEFFQTPKIEKSEFERISDEIETLNIAIDYFENEIERLTDTVAYDKSITLPAAAANIMQAKLHEELIIKLMVDRERLLIKRGKAPMASFRSF